MDTRNRRITNRYSEAFKLQVIEQIEQGRYTANQAAKLYGCCPSSIHGWKKKYGKAHLLNKIVRIETMGEANRIKELEQQVRRLKESLADAHVDQKLSESYLKLACRELGVDPQEFKKKRKHQVIDMNSKGKAKASVSTLCRRAGISRQGYYQGLRARRMRVQAEGKVLELVRSQRARHPRLGTRKLHRLLRPEFTRLSVKLGRDKLFEVLRAHNMLVPKRKARGPRTTDGARTWWKNILDQAPIEAPHQGWVADISYLHTMEGFCYMALISDVYSRKIVGWNVSESLELEGALGALNMALASLPAGKTPIHHSDRGSQYRSKTYTRHLQDAGCPISMTEEDHCAENAQAERVNGILKGEYYLDMVFRDPRQAKQAVKAAIKLYNEERPHLSLNYQFPEQVHRAA